MNEIELNKMNEKITYDEGKIYLEYSKGYTSQLMKRLLKSGYTAVKVGAVHVLKDTNNKEVVNGYSWEGLLYNTAILMR